MLLVGFLLSSSNITTTGSRFLAYHVRSGPVRSLNQCRPMPLKHDPATQPAALASLRVTYAGKGKKAHNIAKTPSVST